MSCDRQKPVCARRVPNLRHLPALAVLFVLPQARAAAPDAPAAGGVQPGVHLGVHLSWVRDPTADGCPDAAGIEAQVVQRLGDNPFARPPTQFIEAVVARPANAFEVTIAMRGPDGRLIGNRALSSTTTACGPVATAAALTIAILIDPEALARIPPAPPPPQPPPPPPARGLAGRVTASAGGGWGLLPRAAWGLGLAVTVDATPHFAAGVSAAFFPERRTAPPDDGFGFGLTSGALYGCWVAIGGGAPDRLRWELCAGTAVGVLHAVVYADQPTGPAERWYLGATELTRVVIPIWPIWASAPTLVAELGIDATQPLPRRAFFVEGRAAGMDTVFTQPLASATAWAGIGMRWK